jgi:cell division septation protein DedD
MATTKPTAPEATEGISEATETLTPTETPTPAPKATETPEKATETQEPAPTTPRQAVYHVYAISTKSKEEADVLADRLARVAKIAIIEDGDIHRVQFFPPTTSRSLATQRLDTLRKYGVHTGHFILM